MHRITDRNPRPSPLLSVVGVAVALGLLLLFAGADNAAAQVSVADTTAPPDSTAETAAAPSTRVATLPTVAPALPDTLVPRNMMLRSALLPGWGQLRNGKPFKALFFAGTAGGFLTAAVLDATSAGDIDDPERRENRVARRNTRFLYFFIATTLSAIDAYVDAHLADFGPEPVTLGPAGPGAPLLHLAWTRTF